MVLNTIFIKNKVFLQYKMFFNETLHCTEVHFASFLSGGFTTMAVMDPPEKKLEKHTSVQ